MAIAAVPDFLLAFRTEVLYSIRANAGVVELADALDSGSSEGNFMEVQVLLPAP